jgi:hypothetical protein
MEMRENKNDKKKIKENEDVDDADTVFDRE